MVINNTSNITVIFYLFPEMSVDRFLAAYIDTDTPKEFPKWESKY